MATGLSHELYLDGAWVDVSGHVLHRSPTTVTAGRTGDDQATSAQCGFLLRDPDGRYWPANPTGTYYGQIGRNTRHRVSVDAAGAHAQIYDGDGDDTISTPDSAGLSVTGDIDVRVDLALDVWHRDTRIIGKWPSSTNRSWLLRTVSGYLRFYWTEDGTTLLYETATAKTPVETGRLSVRVTLDVNNGASGCDVRFYTSSDTDLSTASWTQLGDTQTAGATTSIYDSTATVDIGDMNSDTARFTGRVYTALILDGIGGSTVGSPDFTGAEDGDTTVTDAQSNVWTLNGDAKIVDRDYLWHGEIRDWPHTQDPTGDYQVVSVSSRDLAGRRLSSTTPLRSAYYRGCTSTVAPVEDLLVYWPMEDGPDATQVSPGLAGGPAGTIVGSPSMSANTDFACSDSLPILASSSAFWLPIPGHTTSSAYQVWSLWGFPSTVTASRLFDVRTNGSLARITVNVTAGGALQVTGQDSSGTTIHTGTTYGFGVLGVKARLTLSWYASGADTVYTLSVLEPGSSSGLTTGAQTISGYQHGRPFGIPISPDKTLSDVTVGHVTVQTAITSVFAASDLLDAYAGETAADRLVRLGQEEGIPIRVAGGYTSAMGPQHVDTLHTLMTECETTDDGILAPDPHRLGLLYRTRSSMTGIDAAVTLDYDAGELSGWAPVYDDQLTVNRLELSRRSGGTEVAEIAVGTMSIQDPPDGAGLTPSSLTINVESDTDLPDHATWRLAQGTCDDPRLPSLPVNLARSEITTAQGAAVRALSLGDRVDVTGIPTAHYPGDLAQTLLGAGVTLTRFEHRVDLRCRPYEPLRVARIGTDRVASVVSHDDTDLVDGGVEFAGSQCRSYPSTQQDGDLDVRVYVAMDDWTPSSEEVLVSRYDNSGGASERSWAFLVTAAGLLQCYLSINGSSAYTYYSSTGNGFTDGDSHWVRFYYTASSGNIEFYTSADNITWTQLGTTVTGSAVAGLYDADADFQLGARSAGNLTSDLHGTVHAVHIIDGSEVSPVPTRTNVGADMDTTWTTQSGNLYIDSGPVDYEDYKFEDCRVRVRTGAAVTFTNCWFAGNSSLTSEHGLLDCTHDDVADVTATNCTFTPETPTAYMTGVLGHHFELYDCLITNCVDGVGVYNTASGQGAASTGVIVDGCWIGDHAWFATAPGQSDGSHADCVQLQGGADTVIRNTVLEAYNDITVGDSPWGRVGDPEHRALSAIMITPNVGDITDTLVQNCYLSGGEILVNGSASGNSGNDLGDFIGCSVFDDSWYYEDSVDDWLYMHASSTYSESGTTNITSYPTGAGGGLLAPTDPTLWTDGYDGAGTGSTAIASVTTSQTVLASSATTTATSLSVTVSDAEGWTDDDGSFTAVLGGEQVTVTAVSGTAPSQTLTVTRSVNGVVKAHAAGSPVQLYRPARVGLHHG
jgi:hypothetical protein